MRLGKVTAVQPPPPPADAAVLYDEAQEALGALNREDTDLESKILAASIDPDGADDRQIRAWRGRRAKIEGERRHLVAELDRLSKAAAAENDQHEREREAALIAQIEETTRAAQSRMFCGHSDLIRGWAGWRDGMQRLAELGPVAAAARGRLGAEFDQAHSDAKRAATVAQLQRWSLP